MSVASSRRPAGGTTVYSTRGAVAAVVYRRAATPHAHGNALRTGTHMPKQERGDAAAILDSHGKVIANWLMDNRPVTSLEKPVNEKP